MYSRTKHKDRKRLCMSCLHNVTTKEILNKHRERCLLINYTQAVETGVIKFKNYGKKIPMTFRIYADIERFLKRINIDEGKYTKLYQKHTPNSISAKLVCTNDRFTLDTITFDGRNCI